MNEKNEKEIEAVNIVPQSSINLSRHLKKTKEAEEEYYTWDIKMYCDDLNQAMEQVNLANLSMKKRYGKQ